VVSKREIRKQRVASVQADRAADRAGGRQRRRRKRTVAIVAGVVSLMMILPLAAGLISIFTGGNNSSSATTTSTVAIPTTTTIPAFVNPGLSIAAPVPCPATDGTEARATTFAGPPPTCIDPSATYIADVVTPKGTVQLTIDPALDAVAANLFVVMSEYGFFDGLPIFTSAIDGPAVSGDAGAIEPGFAVPATPATIPVDGGSPYKIGSVVMAADQAQSINTRFAILTTQNVVDALAANPVNPVIGEVSGGIDVLTAIVEDQAAVLSNSTDLVTWLGIAIRIESVNISVSAG